jgi:hypothetical protein
MRRPSCTLLVVIAACCWCSLAPAAQTGAPAPEHTIDLITGPVMPGDETLPRERWLRLDQPMLVDPHGPVKPDPLRVGRPHLDRADYVIGDTFVLEVTFENVSGATIRFPAWRVTDVVDRQLAGARMASLNLAFDDDVLGQQVVGSQAMAGADRFPGSLIDVRPKERVRIRAQNTWVMMRPARVVVPPPWTRPLRVTATVTLAVDGLLYLNQSAGAVEVLLRSRSAISGPALH